MENRIALYPITAIAQNWEEEPLDLSALPATIVQDVTVEDTSPFLNDDAFDWLKGEMGRHDLQAMRAVRYAIVHRYQPKPLEMADESNRNAENLVRGLSACLRLIRPMRQSASFIRGVVQSEGKLRVDHFEHPNQLMEVPDAHKLFTLRNRDLALFKRVGHDFLRGMKGEFWKFRLAVYFHEAGHFPHLYWQARFSLWCSAVEALFTSNTRGHKGSLVAKKRIKWFLGKDTSIYAPGDIPSSSIETEPNITIGDVIDDLYELRNRVAHGDKIPDRFFKQMREGLGGSVTLAEVLNEAISFIIRASLLRILEQNLLSHFADGPASELYFGGHGLTR
ncbi:MAG TPA: hypothetical protein VE263_02120 [Candidatus Angelobacter sp.]|nr:hypothetical protein [Candidatus Angelobacter sp.]